MKTSVLVVDDSSTQRLAWVMEFAKCSQVAPKTARNGAEALAIVRREAPEVLVTDLDMPELDGEDLIREVKRLHPEMFVFVVSAQVTPALRARLAGLRNVYMFSKSDRSAAVRAAFRRIGLGCTRFAACPNPQCNPSAALMATA